MNSLVAQTVKCLPTMWENRVWSRGGDDPLEKEMAPHSSTLAWEIPLEEPGKATVHGVAKSPTRLIDWSTWLHFTSIQNKHLPHPPCQVPLGLGRGSMLYIFCISSSGLLFCYHVYVSHRRRQWHPTPVLLPGKSHGRRSLVGCSPWGREESDTTERFPFHFSL